MSTRIGVSLSVRLSPPCLVRLCFPPPTPGLRMQAAPSGTAVPLMTSLPLKVEFEGHLMSQLLGGGGVCFYTGGDGGQVMEERLLKHACARVVQSMSGGESDAQEVMGGIIHLGFMLKVVCP